MIRKKTSILAILLLTIFITSLIHIPMFSSNDKSTNDQISDNNQLDRDLPKEEPIEFEQLNQLKTADQPESGLNFSFYSKIDDIWNSTWYFENYEQFEDIELPFTEGHNVSYIITISDLKNKTTMQPLLPSDIDQINAYFILGYKNGTYTYKLLSGINDLNYQWLNGCVAFPDDVPGTFLIASNTSIIYNVSISLNSTRSETIRTDFIPEPENTLSEVINWELRVPGYAPGNYSGILEVEDISKFTLHRVLGNEEGYWRPINYTKIGTQFFFNESYLEFMIELQTPNYISVTFNDNLTASNNELRLYTTCNMPGNLTVEFTDNNGTLHRNVTKNVNKGQIVFYNFIMPLNSSGGIGILNVTLTNTSNIYFGAKYAEITFFKEAFIYAFTSNTTAFSQFYVIAPYLDKDIFDDLVERNQTESLGLTIFEVLNQTMIHNATVTYELGEISGELEDITLAMNESGVIYNTSLYFKIVDLSEYQIPPGIYNLTFRASKPGYSSLVFVTEITISEHAVGIKVELLEDEIELEEEFIISFKLNDTETGQNFLMTPVILNLTFTNNETKVVEDSLPIGLVIQELSFPVIIDDNTLPGIYILNITIDSEYYYGSIERIITVKPNELDITLNYESKVDEDEGFDITWDLDYGNFTGNRENMTMEIFLDGILYSVVNFTAMNGSSGAIRFELDDGDHTITYSLDSPFYTAERTIIIEAEKGSSKPKEISWIEENWPFLLLLILAVIAMSIFGVYMTISRRKVKAQRELESELVALKTKYAATEKNVSLIEAQISQIAGIYWILIIHAEQGVTMVEITDFMFDKVLSKEYQQLAEEGVIRDSALIGGFLTAIRNFSRETSDVESEHQAIFNSQTDYSTVVNDKEVHRRILEGSNYFMAFISARGTTEISDVLSAINSIFNGDYGEAVKSFLGRITVFDPFKVESVAYLHNMIIELQKKLEDEKLKLEHYQRHLKQVQDKIGIKKNK